jgi:hypothetical protein
LFEAFEQSIFIERFKGSSKASLEIFKSLSA